MTDFDTAAIDHATEFGTDPTRAALLKAILPHVPQEGWSDRAFEAAAREAEVTVAEARAAAPRGGLDLAAEWHRQADRALVRTLGTTDLSGLKMRERIAFAIKARTEGTADR